MTAIGGWPSTRAPRKAACREALGSGGGGAGGAPLGLQQQAEGASAPRWALLMSLRGEGEAPPPARLGESERIAVRVCSWHGASGCRPPPPPPARKEEETGRQLVFKHLLRAAGPAGGGGCWLLRARIPRDCPSRIVAPAWSGPACDVWGGGSARPLCPSPGIGVCAQPCLRLPPSRAVALAQLAAPQAPTRPRLPGVLHTVLPHCPPSPRASLSALSEGSGPFRTLPPPSPPKKPTQKPNPGVKPHPSVLRRERQSVFAAIPTCRLLGAEACLQKRSWRCAVQTPGAFGCR